MDTWDIIKAAVAVVAFLDLALLALLMLVVLLMLMEHLRITRIGRHEVERESRHVADEPLRQQAGRVLRT